jgi:tRNA G18 (ribose-2'-O)-methylase SpoU
MAKLDAKQLRRSEPKKEELDNIKRNPIYLVLDEIIDTYNIGSLFRLADAISVEKMYLCGNMEYPPSSRIHKAAVGTESWVPWEKADSTSKTVKKLKEKGVQIIVVEQSSKSVSYKNLVPNLPCAVIVGNETKGISKDVIKEADIIVELPMYGINKSFNVWGTAAVISYKILEAIE